jgi:hypothetical protein
MGVLELVDKNLLGICCMPNESLGRSSMCPVHTIHILELSRLHILFLFYSLCHIFPDRQYILLGLCLCIHAGIGHLHSFAQHTSHKPRCWNLHNPVYIVDKHTKDSLCMFQDFSLSSLLCTVLVHMENRWNSWRYHPQTCCSCKRRHCLGSFLRT